jgi:hypothetical protein
VCSNCWYAEFDEGGTTYLPQHPPPIPLTYGRNR